MGRHEAIRTAGFFPRIGARPRAHGPVEPRGRQSDERQDAPFLAEAEAPAVTVTQAMAILERIMQRRAETEGLTSAWADRIQLVP